MHESLHSIHNKLRDHGETKENTVRAYTNHNILPEIINNDSFNPPNDSIYTEKLF